MNRLRENILILKGNLIYTKDANEFCISEDSYIVVKDNSIVGVYKSLPKEYKGVEVKDYKENLIIPGFVDLHLHASQYTLCGLGYDKTLLDWLENYTFKEEAKFKDIEYAKKVYRDFVQELYECGTTRSVIFSSIHTKSTKLLMDLLEQKGLSAFVGKVNMNRNSPDYLIEDTMDSINETLKWVEEYKDRYKNIKPIITPRFAPSCTDELLKELGFIAKQYNLPVQSHLSENTSEVKWVKDLFPKLKGYGDVYREYGLFGTTPTVMAHCVYLTSEEVELMKKNNVFIAHCASSNINISSGIAPINKLMEQGLNIGLGSDISAGDTLNMLSVISSTIKASKLRALNYKDGSRQLKTSEAFYLATKGGGKFFGKVGSFEEGYEFDALVIDDKNLWKFYNGTYEERIEKLIYVGTKNNIVARYSCGKEI
ncbi:MAG: guanine deaminase [Clostridium sp.]|nr:guanine deaminase [Clostridium sp.]